MKKFLFNIFFVFFLIQEGHAQDPPHSHGKNYTPHLCNHHKEERPTNNALRELELQRKNKKNNNSTMAVTATGVQPLVESIHSAVVNWETGSFDSFSIGTQPYLAGSNRHQNIRWGQGLRSDQRSTWGYSYEELRRSAAQMAAPGGNLSGSPDAMPVFNQNQDFYFNMVNPDGTRVSYGPLHFVWSDLGAATNALTINVVTNYGLNGAAGFTNTQRNKMMQFYDLVLPILYDVYGPPSHSYTVNVVNDSYATGTNTFYNGPNIIASSYRENSDGDLDQPRLMIHELVHAMRDNVCVSSDDTWHYLPVLSGFEEGMAESVALIVMERFTTLYPTFFRDREFHKHWGHESSMSFDWDYDFQNHEQISGTDYWSSDQGTGVHWERYGTGAAAFYKMYIEDANVFKKFNAEYYRRMNNNHNLIPDRALMVDILKNNVQKVEEDPTDLWINKQRIFDCRVTPGKKIHMLSFHSDGGGGNMGHDNRIQAIETQNDTNGSEWSWDVYLPPTPPAIYPVLQRWYTQLNNLQGTLEIKKYDGTLFSTISIANNKRDGTTPGPDQGPCPTNNINCWPTSVGIEGHSIYTTSATANYTANYCNNSSWYDNIISSDYPTRYNGTRVKFGLSETGLYTYNITFNHNGTPIKGKYYRLHGNDFVMNCSNPTNVRGGLYAGVRNNADTPVSGKFYVEQKALGEEPVINIANGTLFSPRTWVSVPETDPFRQAGRTDRRYSKPGKVHAIFISSDCSQRKITFRNVNWGASLSGVQMMLFNVDEMKDIEFTANATAAFCEGPATLSVINNFPTYLDTDTRITYTWKNPSGTVIATTNNYTIPSVTAANSGNYTLEINFFGCIITKTVAVVAGSNLTLDAGPDKIMDCASASVTIGPSPIAGATYEWRNSSNVIVGNLSTLTTNTPDTYTLTITTGSSCTATDQVVVYQKKMWTGAINSDWNTAGNWQPINTPVSTDAVTIPSSANNPIIIGTANACNLNIQANAQVIVNPSSSLVVVNEVIVDPSGSLTIEDKGALVQINNSAINIGNIRHKRNVSIRRQDYVYWSSPVADLAVSSISPNTNSGFIFKWLPTTVTGQACNFGNWSNANENMVLGKGYIVRGPDNFAIGMASNFTSTHLGIPNNGNINIPITRGSYTGPNYNYTNGSGSTVTVTTSDDNWNLVGNPYPSAINADSFLTTNTSISGFIKLWTHGTLPSGSQSDPFYSDYAYNYTPADYHTYNLGGSSAGPGTFSGNIASGQGFFVLMNDATPSPGVLNFNNSMRRDASNSPYNNSDFFRNQNISSEKHRIWLDLINSQNNSNIRTLVGYFSEATNENDRLYDAITDEKLNYNFYSLLEQSSDNITLTIQGKAFPFAEEDKIPLGFSVPTNGNYKIAIGALDGIFGNSNQNIYLEDKYLNITHDLKTSPYSFSTNSGRVNDRFILKYTNESLGSSDFDISNNYLKVYPSSNNQITVKSSSDKIKDISIYDVLGKKILERKNINSNETFIENILPTTNILLIKVILENNKIEIRKVVY